MVFFNRGCLEAVTKGERLAQYDLLEVLLESGREDYAKLQVYLKKPDRTELREFSSKLRGVALVIGSEFLVKACVRLEKACASPDSSLEQIYRDGHFLKFNMEVFERAISAELASRN